MSILKQNYRNIELIVVNDGSTDNTSYFIQKIKDVRLIYLEKENGGPSSARNFGIRKAMGKYIGFCDDDDIFLPEKIKTQVSFMEGRPQLGFCYTNGVLVGNGKRKKFIQKLSQRTLSSLVLENSQILTPSVIAKSQVIKEVGGFDESIPLCEDYDLWLRIAHKYPFDFIDKTLVKIKKNKKNISGDEERFFRYGVFVKLKNLKKCRDLLPKSLKTRFEWTLLYQQGKFYFFQNKFNRARKCLIRALQIDPFSVKPIIFIIFSFLGQKKFDNCFIPLYRKLKHKPYIKNWDVKVNHARK